MAETDLLFVGTYTHEPSPARESSGQGIYTCRLTIASGALEIVGVTSAVNPSYLALDAAGPFLYAVSEKQDGAVLAYQVDRGSGQLSRLNQLESQGAFPCYIALDAPRRHAFVSHYGDGSLALLGLAPDGQLSAVKQLHVHHGAGHIPDRQAGPHIHSARPDPSNQLVLAADLGTDEVMIYRLDAAAEPQLSLLSRTPVEPGAGPRHLVFNATGSIVYLVQELNNNVSVFGLTPATGVLTLRQTISMLPPNFSGNSLAADLHLHPAGRFLYASNRGHDSLAIFGIEPRTGRLNLIGHEATRGETPRSFAIDPTGRLLVIANQDSHTLVTFWIDPHTGLLSFTGHTLELPAPACLKFWPA